MQFALSVTPFIYAVHTFRYTVCFLLLTHVCRYMSLQLTPLGKHMLRYKDTIPYTSISENNSSNNTDSQIHSRDMDLHHTNKDLYMAWNKAMAVHNKVVNNRVDCNYWPNFVHRWNCCESQRR